MTRSYEVTKDARLALIVDGEVVIILPFDTVDEASAFGDDYVKRDPERLAARARHPAGRRLAE